MTDTKVTQVRITGWDRAAIITLGAAGCALSYDALQQMAVAIHVRGPLTWLFPLVIDGFIGYGVRALLVMRSASLASRCYVWALFGTATAASIWANALHAVRLNDQSGAGALRLGDVTVGVLSTLAPLALAGAVHLYILIARRAVEPGHPHLADTADTRSGHAAGEGEGAVRSVTGHRLSRVSGGHGDRPVEARPVTTAEAASEAPMNADPGDAPARPAHSGYEGDLLPVARRAVADAGKLTRKVVADAIRGQDIPLSNDRLTELMQQLRAEAGSRPRCSTA
ncbi:DUF2637 domain-containing protein [Streptomyces sp. RTd22]|uniref:DUF2637 domain-containing protein n=1 Tax=Streptomyces sp. RTd22 TaxID=1841249 RepID=UPI0007C59938|nr:DUF2637 domain-containing protein [Streptomyces sp. RTd22]